MLNRFCAFVLTSAVLTAFLLLASFRSTAYGLRNVTLGYWSKVNADDLVEDPVTEDRNASAVDNGLPMGIGTPGSSRPKTTLVMATIASTDTSWLNEELGDLLAEKDRLDTAIYVTNDLTAPLHTPMNKGHEAMAYLTYMIDFYDNLPDISLFMHGHPTAWHNNYLLRMSSSAMVRNLQHDKVLRDGYVNLRCHWGPGCPAHLNPLSTEFDGNKEEELQVAHAWKVLFPSQPLPKVLAQPCCSQFAVTRERLRTLPKERYIHFRDWLIGSTLSDAITGRLFEYFWQIMLNSTPVFCPDPRVCYCEVYGVCFERAIEYEEFFEVAEVWQNTSKAFELWTAWNNGPDRAAGIEEPGEDAVEIERLSQLDEKETVNWTRADWLEYEMEELISELDARKEMAFETGRDSGRKAAAIEAVKYRPLPLPKEETDYPWWL